MSADFSQINLQNSSFEYKLRLMFRLTKTVLITLWPLSAMLLFLSQCIGILGSLISGKANESILPIFYLGMALSILLVSIVIIVMIPSVIVLTNDIVEGRAIRAWTQIIREGISSIGKLIVTTLVFFLIPIGVLILLTGAQIGTEIISNFLSSSNNFFVNLFIGINSLAASLLLLCWYILVLIIRVYWGFYPYVVIINQQVGWQALKFSYRRLKGHWLEVVILDFVLSIVLAISGIPIAIIAFIVSLPFSIFGINTSDAFQLLVFIPLTVAYIIFQLLLFKSYDTSAEATTPASTISNNDTTLNDSPTNDSSTNDSPTNDSPTNNTTTNDSQTNNTTTNDSQTNNTTTNNTTTNDSQTNNTTSDSQTNDK